MGHCTRQTVVQRTGGVVSSNESIGGATLGHENGGLSYPSGTGKCGRVCEESHHKDGRLVRRYSHTLCAVIKPPSGLNDPLQEPICSHHTQSTHKCNPNPTCFVAMIMQIPHTRPRQDAPSCVVAMM